MGRRFSERSTARHDKNYETNPARGTTRTTKRTRREPEFPVPSKHPRPDEWKTPMLWGVADSAPYFHDGGSPTLQAAIRRHKGSAEAVTQAYDKLAETDREAVVTFLKTLKAPADAKPASPAGGAGFAAASASTGQVAARRGR